MKPRLIALLSFAGLASGGFLVLEELGARSESAPVEQRVNANMLRVRVHHRWEDVPMVPLADHLCRSDDARFRPYCD